jgi:hypothetical protein
MSARAVTRRHGYYPRAQTRATRHTRLLRPDGLTRPEYQLTRPTCQTRIRMTSLWRNHDASIHSQQTCHHSVSKPCHCTVIRHVIIVGPTGHFTSREPHRAESSWAEPSELSWAEPWAEGEDSVQRSLRATGSEIESGPFIRPELFWSNLSRLKWDLDDFRLVSS